MENLLIVNFDVIISLKLLGLEKNVQLQSCSESNSEKLCYWKFFSKINNLQDTIIVNGQTDRHTDIITVKQTLI